MTRADMIKNFKLRLGSDEPMPPDSVIGIYLDDAEAMVRTLRRYRPEDAINDVYYPSMIKAAVSLYTERGSEGERSHAENGISIVYENVFAKLLLEVGQVVGGLSNERN